MKFGFSVNGYGVGDLVAVINKISNSEIDRLIRDYEADYIVAATLKKNGAKRGSLREAARIELGLRAFLRGEEIFGGLRPRLKICMGWFNCRGFPSNAFNGRRLRVLELKAIGKSCTPFCGR